MTVPITTLLMVPIITKPPGRGRLFGGKAVILFGGYEREAMRRWQERVRGEVQVPNVQLSLSATEESERPISVERD
jgi:hypothetical protein